MFSTRTVSLRLASITGARFYAVAPKKIVKKSAKAPTSATAKIAAKKATLQARPSAKPVVDYHQQALEMANEGRFEESLKAFQLAMKESPNDSALHANMGAVAIDAGLPDLAEQCLTKANQLKPGDLTVIFHLSRAIQSQASSLVDPAERTPRLDRAEKLLRDGLKKEPVWPEAYADLGNIASAKGDVKSAMKYFEKAIGMSDQIYEAAVASQKSKGTKKSKHAPLSPELGYRLTLTKKTALIGMAEVNLSLGDPVKAVQTFKLAAQQDRQDVDILARIGELYAGPLRKPRRALLFYQECLRMDPENANAHKLLGQLYADPDWSAHDLEKARRCFETSLRFRPSGEGFFHLGWVNIQLGDVARGKECLDRVRRLDKDPERVLHAIALLGDVELVQETPENAKKALKLFEEAAQIANKYKSPAPSLRMSMAKCYIVLGENRRALETLQPVIDASPKNVDALTLLAEVLFAEGRDEDALEIVKRALKIDSKPQQLNFWYGRHLFRSESAGPEKTMKYLSKSIAGIADPIPVEVITKIQEGKAEAPENFALPPPFAGEAHLMLGLLFEGNEQPTEALDHYQMAAAYDPESPVVHIRVGTMLENLNRHSEAQEAYRRASVLDPESVEANFLLGNTCAESEKYEEAILYYRKAAGNTSKRTDEATTDLLFRLYHNMATAHKKMLELTKEPYHEQQAREYLKLANQYGRAE
jgi:tetratricopeptide (TPR) repeat protein